MVVHQIVDAVGGSFKLNEHKHETDISKLCPFKNCVSTLLQAAKSETQNLSKPEPAHI
jgi:hypothetical protein